MKTILLLFISLPVFAQNTISIGNQQNPLCGIEYYNHTEISNFKDYKNIAGAVVGEKNKSGDYQFGVSELTNGKQSIIVFEQLIGHKKNEDGSSSPKNKILDTVIVTVHENEYLHIYDCRQDSMNNNCLIALVIDEKDKKYRDQIVKAWLLNTETGIIIQLKNTKGIDCYNDAFDPIEQSPILYEVIKKE